MSSWRKVVLQLCLCPLRSLKNLFSDPNYSLSILSLGARIGSHGFHTKPITPSATSPFQNSPLPSNPTSSLLSAWKAHQHPKLNMVKNEFISTQTLLSFMLTNRKPLLFLSTKYPSAPLSSSAVLASFLTPHFASLPTFCLLPKSNASSFTALLGCHPSCHLVWILMMS